MNKDALTTALSNFISDVVQLSEDTQETEDSRIYGMYLAKAEAILGKVVRDEPIDDDIDSMEKLFGSTWLKNEESYSRAYSGWDRFKQLLMQSIHGMTVNERLFNLGLLDEFNNAVTQGDELHLRKVLYKCFLDEQNIQAIIVQQFAKKKHNSLS